MRQNLDALHTDIYCGISNWNDFTESDTGERILTESEVGEYARNLYEKMITDMFEEGLIQ